MNNHRPGELKEAEEAGTVVMAEGYGDEGVVVLLGCGDSAYVLFLCVQKFKASESPPLKYFFLG